MSKKGIFFRYCKRCDKRFKPNGKAQTLCEECKKYNRTTRKRDLQIKKKMEKLK